MKTIEQFAENILKPYIDDEDNKFAANIAPVEEDATSASQGYAVGQQLILDGVLYDVTAAITAGDPLATTGAGANISAADDVTTQLSSVKQALANEAETRATLGAHNFWKSSAVSESKDSGNAVFTVSSDGIINVKTTNAVGSDFVYYLNYAEVLSAPIPVGTYTLTGCPSGGTDSTYYLSFVMTFENETSLQKKEYGNGETFTITSPIKSLNAYFVVKAGTSFNNVKIKPMLALSTDPCKAYTPYAMTNQQLTDKVTLETVDLAQYCDTDYVDTTETFLKAYKVGKICIISGYFKAKVSLSSATVIATLPNSLKAVANEFIGSAFIGTTPCSMNVSGASVTIKPSSIAANSFVSVSVVFATAE